MEIEVFKEGHKICDGVTIPKGFEIHKESNEVRTARHVEVTWFFNEVKKVSFSYTIFKPNRELTQPNQELMKSLDDCYFNFVVSGFMTIAQHQECFHTK
jgi:hypothetical protein